MSDKLPPSDYLHARMKHSECGFFYLSERLFVQPPWKNSLYFIVSLALSCLLQVISLNILHLTARSSITDSVECRPHDKIIFVQSQKFLYATF